MQIDVPLFQGLSLKISDASTASKEYPTALLQKGLLLLDHDQELAEEAVGFGVPVLKQGLQTIFPGAVALTGLQQGSTWDITALYTLNLVEKTSRRGNQNVENRAFYTVKNFMAAVIRRVPMFRNLLITISGKLKQMLNLETTYADAGFSTEVKVIYTIGGQTGKVSVEVDTRDLPPSITEVVMMNEQGAHHFGRYRDTSGVALEGEEISCWDQVNAQEAWFESSAHQVAFRLGQVKGVRLFRGRELLSSQLAWAGFGYSFPPSTKNVKYDIRIEKLP